jgi:hypothetical protein
MASARDNTYGNSTPVYRTDWRASQANKELETIIEDGRVTAADVAKVVKNRMYRSSERTTILVPCWYIALVKGR